MVDRMRLKSVIYPHSYLPSRVTLVEEIYSTASFGLVLIIH